MGQNGSEWKHGWVPVNAEARLIAARRKAAGLPKGGTEPVSSVGAYSVTEKPGIGKSGPKHVVTRTSTGTEISSHSNRGDAMGVAHEHAERDAARSVSNDAKRVSQDQASNARSQASKAAVKRVRRTKDGRVMLLTDGPMNPVGMSTATLIAALKNPKFTSAQKAAIRKVLAVRGVSLATVTAEKAKRANA